jgi:hypothetical protein
VAIFDVPQRFSQKWVHDLSLVPITSCTRTVLLSPGRSEQLSDSWGVTLRCGFCEEPGTLELAGRLCAARSTLVARRLTLALGLHWLMAGGMQNGDVLQAGWGLPATPRRPGTMLPLSVRLRVTRPALNYQVADSEPWAGSVGRVSLRRAGRSARHHTSGQVRPLNRRASLARGPHWPVRSTNRGNPIRGHRFDRPDPRQGDGHDCEYLGVTSPRAGAQDAATGALRRLGPRRPQVGAGRR